MAVHHKSFDDAYYATCPTCGEALEWEWQEDDLFFEASCCLKTHKLTPSGGETEVVVEGDEEDYFDEN